MADAIANVRITAQDDASGAIRSVDAALEGLESTAGEVGRDLGEASRGIQEVGEASDQAEGSTGRFVITLGDIIQVARTVKDAIFGAVETLIDWANEAGQAELTTRRIETSLRSYGVAAKAVTKDLTDFAESQSHVTTASEDAIKSGIALISAVTKNTDQIKAATLAALEFSAATGVELSTSFTLFAKAAEGNTAALARYGLTIDEALPKSQKFAEVIRQVNEKMGGAAAAQVTTYAGEVKQLGNAWDQVKEALGRFVTDSDTVNSAISGSTQALGSLAVIIDGVAKNTMPDLTDSTNDATVAFAQNALAALGIGTGLNAATVATEAATAATEAATEAAIAKAKADVEVAQRATEAAEVLKELGVTSMAESEKQAQVLNAQLALLAQALADGSIKALEFAAAQDAINEKLANIQGTIQNTIREIDAEAAAHQKLVDQWDAEDAAASRASEAIDETTDSLNRNKEAAEGAAAGWLSFTQARSSDSRTDVQIAEDNLEAIRLLGPNVSTPGQVGATGALQMAMRAVDAAKARETAGSTGAGGTVPLATSPIGRLAGGARTLDMLLKP